MGSASFVSNKAFLKVNFLYFPPHDKVFFDAVKVIFFKKISFKIVLKGDLKKKELKNAFANYALHFSLSAFYFVVGCQRDFLFGLPTVTFIHSACCLERIKSWYVQNYFKKGTAPMSTSRSN